MFKSGKSKGEKSKKLPKSGNSLNFNTKNSGPSFITPEARSDFNRLWLAFTKALILQYFDPKYYIYIETDALGYAIADVLSQLASGTSFYGVVSKTDLGQLYPVTFFSKKMILAETQYKTHNGRFLAIVEVLNTWRHYLKGSKYEVLIVTDYNNLRYFIDIKNLSFRQIRWAQELSWYHFWIDYRQGKANAAGDALSQFPQRSQNKKDELRAENGQIFHCLQNSLTIASLTELILLFFLPSHLD